MRGWRCYAADPQEHLQFNKIPTEGTYINKINKINTKGREPDFPVKHALGAFGPGAD